MLKKLLKNKKGQQLIEVLIAVFLAGFFISGLDSFYQFTGDFQKVKDFTYAEKHFTFIQNLFSQNCDSFIGDKLLYSSYENQNPISGQDPSIPQITMRDSEPPFNHNLLYTTRDIPGHTLSDHSYIGIKEMTLEKMTAESALFTIVFESLKTFEEYKKTVKIYVSLDSHNRIEKCSLKPILPCPEQDIEINYIWEEKQGSKSKKYNCLAKKKTETSKTHMRKIGAGWLGGKEALPGEIVNITDTSSKCCICLIQLQCSEGFWSRSSDCFKRKDGCNSCPKGYKWDKASSSCAVKLPSCKGGKVLDISSKECFCPKDTSWNGSSCVKCVDGAIWNNDSEKCWCPDGATWNPNIKKCVCADGANWNGKNCVCPGGQMWSASSRTCSCPLGTSWDGLSCVTPPPPSDLEEPEGEPSTPPESKGGSG